MKRKNKIIISFISALLIVILILSLFAFWYLGYQEPETTVSKLRLIDVNERELSFKVGIVISIHNPNNLDLEVTGIEGDLFIDDERIAPMYNETGVTVKAGGSSVIEMELPVDDPELMVLKGDQLRIKGRSYGEYLWVKGSSEFEETMELPGPDDAPSNLPPIALINGPRSAMTGEEVTFDGSMSSDNDGQITEYSWDLDDGNTAMGEAINHEYSDPGIYQVELTVTDDDGGRTTATHQITILGLP